MNELNYSRCYSFAVGYYDGRSKGEEACPYVDGDPLRHFYHAGYDAGVADFCELDCSEDQHG